jgi:hypothetical protein
MMKFKTVVIALGAMIFIAVAAIYLLLYFIPSDVVDAAYVNASDAFEKNAIDHGMVPDFLPKSATQILASRNIDLNWTITEFSYSEDFVEFLEKQKKFKLPSNISIPRLKGGTFDSSNIDSLTYVPCTGEFEDRGALIINMAQRRVIYIYPPFDKFSCSPMEKNEHRKKNMGRITIK